MIRSTIGKHRARASVVAATAGGALIVVACETPMPQELAGLSLSVAETEASGRLATTVASNWITQAQADRIARHLRETAERLHNAVRAGRIAEEEARRPTSARSLMRSAERFVRMSARVR